MKNIKIINELYKRKIIYQISNKKKFIDYIKNKKSINLYCGLDPTNDSLHIGHLILLTLLKRFYNKYNNIYIIIGNSTALIGDPSLKFNNINNNINIEKIEYYSQKIILQINKFTEINNFKVNIINNKLWYKKINIINFLKNIGSNFYIKKIINNLFIKNKLYNNNIKFSELSYILLQSYDYLIMNKKYNIDLQIGGSDQWNNIIYGINLIKKKYKKDVFGLTFPILTDKNNIKFGKSNINNNLWIDNKKTTPYEIYQYIININDKEVYKLYKLLTFKNLEDINNLEKNNTKKNIILIKKKLAINIINIIHGKLFNNIINIINKIFNNDFNLNNQEFEELISFGIKKIFINNDELLENLIFKFNIFKYKNKIKDIIKNGGIKINNNIIINNKYIFSKKDLLYNKYAFIFKSKKEIFLIIWI